jgi:hypothetical protein
MFGTTVKGRSVRARVWRFGGGGSALGGDDGTRTHDPRLAKPVLFQLSYVPLVVGDSQAV